MWPELPSRLQLANMTSRFIEHSMALHPDMSECLTMLWRPA
jgi:hypothetical protein